MLISTRGRYAIRVMLDLAENQEQGYIPLKQIAERQEISLKYLERIMPSLVKEDLVEGIHGKNGGYRLSRNPADYKIGDILKITEGDLVPVACLKDNPNTCNRSSFCKTLPMWTELNQIVNNYFDQKTLQDLLK